MSALFQRGTFTLASGKVSKYKLECDSLTHEDWQTIAERMTEIVPRFGSVVGVPKGGLYLAKCLVPYADPMIQRTLVVDDVWTTGKSMTEFILDHELDTDRVIGAVVFSRGVLPWWVSTLCEVKF